MGVVRTIVSISIFACNFHNILSIGPDETTGESIVQPYVIGGDLIPHTENPTAPPTAPPTNKPTKKPTASPTNKPTKIPTASPTEVPCLGTRFKATFDAPKANPSDFGIKGMFKGSYLKQGKASLFLSINFGDWKANKVNLKTGDELEWSINTNWQDNPDAFGWNNKCREARTGLHYDQSVACGPLSEKVVTASKRTRRRLVVNSPYCLKDNGRKVLTSAYECNGTNIKKTCERGDMSGKLGKLIVTATKNGYPKVVYRGVDKYFPKRKFAEDPETNWSIVISKNGERFFCAQFILICDNK